VIPERKDNEKYNKEQSEKVRVKMEKGYAENWANYIERQNMTMDEALDYIKNSNSQKDRHAHIVDMDRGFRSSK